MEQLWIGFFYCPIISVSVVLAWLDLTIDSYQSNFFTQCKIFVTLSGLNLHLLFCISWLIQNHKKRRICVSWHMLSCFNSFLPSQTSALIWLLNECTNNKDTLTQILIHHIVFLTWHADLGPFGQRPLSPQSLAMPTKNS